MKKSDILENEIISALEKIKTLTENDRQEVHNLFLNIYSIFLELPKEEFINEYYYFAYKKTISKFKDTFEMELLSLLDNKDNTNISDNFFHIKGSLIMMLPKKFTKQ